MTKLVAYGAWTKTEETAIEADLRAWGSTTRVSFYSENDALTSAMRAKLIAEKERDEARAELAALREEVRK